MKKISTHLYIVLGLFVITFILGTFLDLNVSQTLFSRNNVFGLAVSVIGTMPGYGMFALIGGLSFYLGLKYDYKTIIKIILIAVGIGFYGLGVFFSGREFFGLNGFTGVLPKFVGYFISAPIFAPLFFVGYLMGKNSDNKASLWILIAVVATAIFISLVPGTTLLKDIFHRPRYRMVSSNTADIGFHAWYQRCGDYKSFLNGNYQFNGYNGMVEITKEEFKSFPSGHASASAVFMLCVAFLPLVNKKYEHIQIPLFYVGLAWSLLVCYSRILVGAHYLSDVSMGSILTIACAIIAYQIVSHLKQFKTDDVPQVEEN